MSEATRAENATPVPYNLEAHYQELEQKITSAGIPADLGRVRAAFECADRAHSGQKRRDGSPYVSHCIAAAIITAEMGLDEDSIISALLHDTIEDTSLTHNDIARSFGTSVADIVEGVTKLTRVQYTSVEEQQMENMRKMLLAMAKDIRVILIKMADRLHNMRTMAYQSEEKQRIKSLETMEIYAPIAHRLGMQKIKWELEDLSLLYLDPDGYRAITDALEARMPTLEKFMDEMRTQIRERLELDGVHATISSRIKHIYSIYRKMYAQKLDINGIFDLCAFRVIVDTIPDCYNVLGIIHDMYKPLPGRFKDYISTPKPNMYQSLHTTLIGPGGRPFEIQIRTFEMHRTAEYGIAAHWKYKEASNNGGNVNVSRQEEEKLSWLRQILEWQKDMSDGKEFMSLLKSDLDLFAESVYCFTPAGDVKNLPNGSTPIDFAYSIHSAVGNKMIGARANGKLVNIDYVIQNGDRIEIITSQNSKGPSRDWLKIVRTSEAKSKIRNWFKKMRREENIQEGRDTLARELRREMIFIPDDQLDEFVGSCSRRLRQNNAEEIYAAIGYGGMTIANCLPKLKEEWQKLKAAEAAENKSMEDLPKVDLSRVHATDGVVVEGFDNTPIKFAKCCSPLPGDPIVGFITRGFGVSIHKQSCVNAISSMKDPTNAPRWVKAYWADSVKDSYKAGLEIVALDRNELLRDVLSALADIRVPIYTMNARQVENNCAVVSLTIGINNTEHLNRVVARLSKVKDVLKVTRS